MNFSPDDFIETDATNFKQFVDNYPKKLERYVSQIVDPPIVSYNDFSRGNYPDSVVAHFSSSGGNPDNIYDDTPCNFRILNTQ